MFEIILYFFRKKPFFFYTFLLLFALIYGYILALFIFDFSKGFLKDIFIVTVFLAIFWTFGFWISFKNSFEVLKIELEKEKFDGFKNSIISEYNLEKDKNVFLKIEMLKAFVDANFDKQSLMSYKIIKLINKALDIYIKNLRYEKDLFKTLNLTINNDKKDKILYKKDEISKQNKKLLDYLDSYLSELSVKNSTDKEILLLENELNRTMDILKTVKNDKT